MDKSRLINAVFLFLFFFSFLNNSDAQATDSAINASRDKWVDSVMSTLSVDDMIGQLIIVRANNPMQEYFDVIDSYIKQYNIGGVTFFGGHPGLQAKQTNHWQSITRIPLLIAIDAEWGLGMRLDSVISFPYQMTLGAIKDDSLIYEMGRETGKQCKRLGIQMNFAPVVDINSNPANPVIHMRSFGENRSKVASKGLEYMRGLQDEGIIATAKHFPGHGDAGSDSHLTLPVINQSRKRLDTLELVPFKNLIDQGLSGIMIAHLYIPAIEKKPNIPSTFSKNIVSGLLRDELGFKGLIVTDALDMKGVTRDNKPGEIEVKALLAGNDILLLPADVSSAVSSIRNAVQAGIIPEQLIRDKCRKVLQYKYDAGLSELQPVKLQKLYEDLNNNYAKLLNQRLFEEAITVVKNDRNMIPLKRLDTLRIASVSIGDGQQTPFQERLSYYASIRHFYLQKEPSNQEISDLIKTLSHFNLIIISIQRTNIWDSKTFGISDQAIKLVKAIQETKDVVLDLFASPYSLRLFDGINKINAIILSYQDHPESQDISAQVIFGGIAAHGRLPVTASASFPYNSGFDTEAIRLKYTMPGDLPINPDDLRGIDSLINDCIAKRIFPGCQAFAAKDGKVFFLRSYGHHTYDTTNQVGNFDLYDIASLTKIVASTISIMRLSDEGRLDIDQVLSHYLPYLRNTDKGNIVIRDVLAHQSRLKPWIPFYSFLMKNDTLDTAFFSRTISEDFPMRVADSLYISKDFGHVMLDSIISSKLLNNGGYKYSDLGYYFMKDIIEIITNKPFNHYVEETFYKPLGLSTTGFLPRKRFPIDRIVPTENDTIFRKQLIHGDVHDPGAAMLGGVAGHAGVFSDANDLGVIMQMLMNEGKYGGEQYILPATVKEFTKYQFPVNNNRRGIGFDKPFQEYDKNGPCCKSASQLSYGHSGFTGTYLWADPENGLIFVFLSNRVYPSAENNRLADMNIRSRLHQIFYDAIEKSANFAGH